MREAKVVCFVFCSFSFTRRGKDKKPIEEE